MRHPIPQPKLSRKLISAAVAMFLTAAWSASIRADGQPIFHMDFSSFADVSGNDLAIEAGDAVSLLPGGGPTLEGGKTLDAARWEGEDDDTNQIIIFDNPLLDAVSVSAGSIVTWIRVDDDTEWNNIAKTVCVDHLEPCDAFGQFAGIEFQASLHAGLFGAVQGWETNVFGPNAPQNGGDGAETPSEEWTHAALTWNADGDHTIYVNGEPGPTFIGVGDEEFGANLTEDWSIGGDGLNATAPHTDLTRRLRGALADFAIYDGELAEDEILNIMRTGVLTSVPGDFNRDGVLDELDIDDLTTQSAGGTHPADYDLNGDALVDGNDVKVWITDLFNSWVGDADLDGQFNSSDLVAVLASGTYESGGASVWTSGDFDGDGVTNSGDLVASLADGGYEQGPRAATSAVPEPSTAVLLVFGWLIVSRCASFSLKTVRRGH